MPSAPRRAALTLAALLTCPAAFAQTVARYDVFEHTISHSFDSSTGNPWEDVQVDVTLTSPGGSSYAIGGFHYDDDTWKFRFSPDQEGLWSWSYVLREGATTVTDSGTFDVVASASSGPVRLSPYNPLRWVFEDGTPFYPHGAQECVNPPGEPWYLDKDTPVSRLQCLQTLATEAGINLWRLNVANCSWSLWWQIEPAGNIYSVRAGKLFDDTAADIRAAGMRIYMTIFGTLNRLPYPNDSDDPAKMASVERYVKYISDRYGAYVDFWELANEVASDEIDQAWIERISPYMRSVDPYDHPISFSHARGPLPEIDIDAPHHYSSPRWSRLDSDWLLDVAGRRAFGKPVMYGEVGNLDCNDEPDSAVRWRAVAWMLFFNEASLTFWNTAEVDDFCQPMSGNVYMDAPFRANQRPLSVYRDDFDPAAEMVSVTSSDASLHAWGLSGPLHYGAYLYSFANPFGVTSGATVNVAPRGRATGSWIRPSDGAVLAPVSIPAGSQTIPVPSFTTDVALKLDIDPGVAPTVDAGSDRTIQLAIDDTISLDGSVVDPDGPPTVAWSLTSGPAPVQIADPAVVDTGVSFDEVGVYTLTLTADDLLNPPVADSVVVTVEGSAPEVRNVAALAITADAALLTGRLESTGGDDTEVHLYWGRTDGGTDPAAWESTATLGSFSDAPPADLESAATMLLPATSYFYRYRANNAFGETWAPTSTSFATPARVRRGETLPPATLVDSELPWSDPDPVLAGGFPSLLFYAVDGVQEVVLVRAADSVRIAPP